MSAHLLVESDAAWRAKCDSSSEPTHWKRKAESARNSALALAATLKTLPAGDLRDVQKARLVFFVRYGDLALKVKASAVKGKVPRVDHQVLVLRPHAERAVRASCLGTHKVLWSLMLSLHAFYKLHQARKAIKSEKRSPVGPGVAVPGIGPGFVFENRGKVSRLSARVWWSETKFCRRLQQTLPPCSRRHGRRDAERAAGRHIDHACRRHIVRDLHRCLWRIHRRHRGYRYFRILRYVNVCISVPERAHLFGCTLVRLIISVPPLAQALVVITP